MRLTRQRTHGHFRVRPRRADGRRHARSSTSRPYLAVDSDVDGVRPAREAGYNVIFGDVSRPELADKLQLGHAAALVLTMDDPVLVARIAQTRARLGAGPADHRQSARHGHAAQLYKAGVTDAVPETLEASLQLSEAVLVDIGVAMGPVIASIHEKRDQLRAKIRAEADLSRAAAPPRAPARARDASGFRHRLEPEHARQIGLVLGVVDSDGDCHRSLALPGNRTATRLRGTRR